MKPIRHMSTTRAHALPAPASLHPMVLWALMLATLLLMSIPRLAGAQDLLANARTQYQAAAYDEALTTLQQLAANKATLSATDARDVEEYRFLCLLALGRKDEARSAMGIVVKSDPLYTLDAAATPPRVVTAFTEVRRELLPQIATQLYAESKAAYDKKAHGRRAGRLRAADADAGRPGHAGQAGRPRHARQGLPGFVGHGRYARGRGRAGRRAGRTGRRRPPWSCRRSRSCRRCRRFRRT